MLSQPRNEFTQLKEGWKYRHGKLFSFSVILTNKNKTMTLTPVAAVQVPVQNISFPNGFLSDQREKLENLQEALFEQYDDHSSQSKEDGVTSGGMHLGDASSSATEREFALTLVCMEHDAMKEVYDALQRLNNGTYGICEITGQPIPIERLEARPYARYTVKAQEEVERGGHRAFIASRISSLFVNRDEEEVEDEA